MRDSVKEPRDWILQLRVVSLLEWKVHTNTVNSGPSFLKIESTNCSSLLSIPHYLHCMTRDLNFEKKYCIVSKLLGCSDINSFYRIWPLYSSFSPKKDSSFSHTSFVGFSPSRWNSNSLEMWMHIKPNASSACSDTSNFQEVVKVQPICPWWPCIDLCCATLSSYHPSNKYSWRVWGFWESILLNYPSCSFKEQLIIHNYSIYLQKHFNSK